ncbi:hypothetical protein D3C71_1857990 [compost metagenome]
MHSERLFFQRQSQLLAKLDNRQAGDAFQRSQVARRRIHYSSFDDENIITRAFGYITLSVHHNRFVGFRQIGLDFDQDVVQIVKRLDLRIKGIREVAALRYRNCA